MVALFGLWSICEPSPSRRAAWSERQDRAMAPSLLRGHHLGGGRRAPPGARAARRMGAAPPPPCRRVARARRGPILVDADQRLLRQRRDAHGRAQLLLGRHAAARDARSAAGVLPADARGLGALRALRQAAATDRGGNGLLRGR